MQCHGSGLPEDDRAELEALREVLAPAAPLPLGTVSVCALAEHFRFPSRAETWETAALPRRAGRSCRTSGPVATSYADGSSTSGDSNWVGPTGPASTSSWDSSRPTWAKSASRTRRGSRPWRDGPWGRLVRRLIEDSGVRGLDPMVLLDRKDPVAALRTLTELGAAMQREHFSLAVHVEGTRSRRCREPIRTMSTLFVDLARSLELSVVPLRLSGALPAGSCPHGSSSRWAPPART